MENKKRIEEMNFGELIGMHEKQENARTIRAFLGGMNHSWTVNPAGGYMFCAFLNDTIAAARQTLLPTMEGMQLRIDLPVFVLHHARIADIRAFVNTLNGWMNAWEHSPRLELVEDYSIALHSEFAVDHDKSALKNFFAMRLWVTMHQLLAGNITDCLLHLMYNPAMSLEEALAITEKKICSQQKVPTDEN